jgi:hypothetical protein
MSQYLSLKDHVYNYISEKINDGSLKPEDKINEQQISDAIGARTTLYFSSIFPILSFFILYYCISRA